MVGMGDRVCVDLCSLMRPGEGLLVCLPVYTLFLQHKVLIFTILISIEVSIFTLLTRLDLLLEDSSWFTQNAWSLITLKADHLELTLCVFFSFIFHLLDLFLL